MATKAVDITNLGTVKLYKRRGVKNIKLSLGADGKIRVTMPLWVPYAAGVRFAQQKEAWILAQQVKPKPLHEGQAIGRRHRLCFISGAKLATRLKDLNVQITVPDGKSATDDDVQEIAFKAAVRALKKQARETLPNRLSELAQIHGFNVSKITIKKLKGRWGSCDQHNNITLNCFLMQIPDEYIDYVLLHELVHTKVLAHGPKFWAEFERCLPNAKRYRKDMRRFSPSFSITSMA